MIVACLDPGTDTTPKREAASISSDRKGGGQGEKLLRPLSKGAVLDLANRCLLILEEENQMLRKENEHLGTLLRLAG